MSDNGHQFRFFHRTYNVQRNDWFSDSHDPPIESACNFTLAWRNVSFINCVIKLKSIFSVSNQLAVNQDFQTTPSVSESIEARRSMSRRATILRSRIESRFSPDFTTRHQTSVYHKANKDSSESLLNRTFHSVSSTKETKIKEKKYIKIEKTLSSDFSLPSDCAALGSSSLPSIEPKIYSRV